MKIELEVSEDNEGTSEPWWLIVDPRQSLKVDATYIADMITGPFFSRVSAENHLTNRRYAFGKHAIVWCASGCWSFEYKEAVGKAKARKDRESRGVEGKAEE